MNMKRYLYQSILFTLTMTACCTATQQAYAQQPKTYESQVSYQKSVQTAILVDLPYPTDVVESSIKEYMARNGWKGASSRGYKVYKNMKLDNADTSLSDLHIMVDRKSSRDKSNSIVTVLAARAGEDPATRTGKDAGMINKTAAFMEKMLPAIEAGDLEDRIKTQEDDTKKAQNKLGNLHDEQGSLEKKIRNTEDDLKENKADQIKETQAMQSSVKNDDAAMKKSHKKIDKLLDDQTSLQKKLAKYQADLEQNKKNQEFQRTAAGQQQQTLDSLKTLRKH
jgi:predicted  nucleic acid-binding Zn-ribbon protein